MSTDFHLLNDARRYSVSVTLVFHARWSKFHGVRRKFDSTRDAIMSSHASSPFSSVPLRYAPIHYQDSIRPVATRSDRSAVLRTHVPRGVRSNTPSCALPNSVASGTNGLFLCCNTAAVLSRGLRCQASSGSESCANPDGTAGAPFGASNQRLQCFLPSAHHQHRASRCAAPFPVVLTGLRLHACPSQSLQTQRPRRQVRC